MADEDQVYDPAHPTSLSLLSLLTEQASAGSQLVKMPHWGRKEIPYLTRWQKEADSADAVSKSPVHP